MDAHPPLPPEIWEQTPPTAQEMILRHAAELAQLRGEVAQLKATVEELARRLARNSRNSSPPPSTDPPQAQSQRVRRAANGRRPGGQPGHEGQTRALVPVEAVDVVIPLKPVRCTRCQHLLLGEDPRPERHQVTELPPVRPVITEYQLHRVVCPACGAATRAVWPVGIPTGGFGPRVQAITALCTGAYHLSKRTTQTMLTALFGVSIGLGTVANLEQATVRALAEPVAEARAFVQAQPTADLDETGWREGQQRAWLWTMVTTWVTVFVVRRSRGSKVARELLGERFWGWLVTDRWSAYTWYPTWRRQVCWAHLLRDIEAMIERGGRSQEIGEALRVQVRLMFQWWHRVRAGTLAHTSFASYMRPIRQEVERLLEAGQTCGVPKTEGTCREILKMRQALWTFVRHEGVEPTNNAAERAIRPGVLWRKGSFGTQSPDGSRFVESMMTVVATLKQQHRNVLDDVLEVCEAVLCSQPAPSLLPTSTALEQLLYPAA
jgi:transposase